MKVLLNVAFIPKNSCGFFVNSYESIGHFCNKYYVHQILCCEEFEMFQKEYNIKEPYINKNNNIRLGI